GLTQRAVRDYVYEHARIDARELAATGTRIEHNAQHDMSGDVLDTIRSPDDILLVTAGGEGAGWSVWVPSWAPIIHAYRATRRVRPAADPPPDCGPEGCLVPWARYPPTAPTSPSRRTRRSRSPNARRCPSD